jgi:predicted RNA-binding protein with PUA-like domain
MAWWLVKQEPEDYPFSQLLKDSVTPWTGVRNFQARNNLKAMAVGDQVFYYHSGTHKAIVGLATVAKTAYPDPTTTEEGWVCVDIRAGRALAKPVTLARIKAEKALHNMALVKQSRLSVMPVSASEAATILKLAGK